jgi:hypothetical protein
MNANIIGIPFDPLEPDGDKDPFKRAPKFLERALDYVFDLYAQALALGMEQPVILLFDMSDPKAREAAINFGLQDKVDAHLAERDGGAPPATRGVMIAKPYEWVRTALPSMKPPTGPENIKVAVCTCGALVRLNADKLLDRLMAGETIGDGTDHDE